MNISGSEQCGYDFDWFAVDSDGCLIHFTSFGGVLPASVAASKESLVALGRYFSVLPELSTNEEIRATFTDAMPDGDLISYMKYVRRGFFSFDRTDFNNMNPLFTI